MKNQIISKIIFALVGIISFGSCTLDNDETTASFFSSQEFELISNSLSMENTLPNYSSSEEENRDMLFDAKALLGRVLFYDEHLSIDNSTSCASCHDQKLGFADDKAFSEGINGQVTERNSIAFSAVGSDNSSDNPYFGGDDSFGASMFWDHRASSVTEQLKETIENDIEMGMPLAELPGKLNELDYLQVLFKKAYSDGDPYYTIQEDDILDALLKFMQSLNPSNSKFDQFNEARFSGQISAVQLTVSEEQGLFLYESTCANCHGFGAGQPASRTANNGLDMIYTDSGDGNDRFKIPALRNVALSAPYMHDGRFETLEDVIEHYSSGINRTSNLSHDFSHLFSNQVGNQQGFNFTDQEKTALLQFLNTLTDESFINDVRFESPF